MRNRFDDESGLRELSAGPRAVAIALALMALLALVVTGIESDSGWEDAVWRDPGASRTAALLTSFGALWAAGAAVSLGWRPGLSRDRRRARLFAGCVFASVTLLLVWLGVLVGAPS